MGPEMKLQNCQGQELDSMDCPRLSCRANVQAGDCASDRGGTE